MVETKWKILELQSNPDFGVVEAHWEAIKVDGEHRAKLFGAITFTPNPDSENYIAYDSLTEETVISWIKNHEECSKVEEYLEGQLNELKTPPKTVTALPW
jgi:hypothetical protein